MTSDNLRQVLPPTLLAFNFSDAAGLVDISGSSPSRSGDDRIQLITFVPLEEPAAARM
jgi:hypothetical protein